MSYHLLKIHKHNHDSPFKLMEESLEFIDSLSQNNKIMAAVELSDLLGALKVQAEKLNLTLEDLEIMNSATTRAFKGDRPSFNLFDYLKKEHQTIKEFGLGFIQIKIDNFNYNFYTDKVKKFDNYDMPHNHQTNFISEVIKGELVEYIYDLTPGEEILNCVCGNPENKLKDVNYLFKEKIIHKQGSLYFRNKQHFHSVEAVNTITKVMKIGDKTDAFAFGQSVDYIKDKTEEDLWKIVKEMTQTI